MRQIPEDARKIGDWIIPDEMDWVNRWEHLNAWQAINYPLGGSLVVHEGVNNGGQIITLSVYQEGGWHRGAWLTWAEVRALWHMINTPAASYPFVWDDFSTTVVFDKSKPLTIQPFYNYSGIKEHETDLFDVTLSLIALNNIDWSNV